MSQPQRLQAVSAASHPSREANRGAKLPDSLEDALHAVVYESALPAKAIASAIGVRYGYLVEAANPNREDTHFQVRWVPPITNASGNDALIRFLAHACGGAFIRLNAGAAFNERTASVLKETADYLQTVAVAEADGTVTADEASEARKQADEAIEALLAHVQWMESRVRREVRA
jgi:hypothetical protein